MDQLSTLKNLIIIIRISYKTLANSVLFDH